MAPSPQLIATLYDEVLLRISAHDFATLRRLLFSRYPKYEWATFARIGWRDAGGCLVLSLAGIDAPGPGDLDDGVGHVAIQERYTLRIALAAERHPLAVCVIHSHPLGAVPAPSCVDDDMDAYYGDYFAGFAPSRPYVSLIFSEIGNEIVISGRVRVKDAWVRVSRVAVEHEQRVRVWKGAEWSPEVRIAPERTARLSAAFGNEAADRLRRSTVAVIGAGGTGSAAIEALARAGVGRLIIVDPDKLDTSNLERVHGSTPPDASRRISKALLAARHVQAIDSHCNVEAYIGALPQPEIVTAVALADVALGCTDQQHSRLALSDMAIRYLIPAIDCGVVMEGSRGQMTGQIMQFTSLRPSDPCIICRRMIDPTKISQELASPDEREQRRIAAKLARANGQDGTAYWREEPQLNTVGYLTTAAGAMAAGYVIGWLTGRFDPPFTRLQMNWSAKFLDVTDVADLADPECSCRHVKGWADQAAADAYVSPPRHWPAATRMSADDLDAEESLGW